MSREVTGDKYSVRDLEVISDLYRRSSNRMTIQARMQDSKHGKDD